MGRTNGRYNAEYPIGTKVRVVDTAELELFSKEWTLHHPLKPEQISFGGHEAEVLNVYFYHGGYELYELSGVMGIWHEQCLQAVGEG